MSKRALGAIILGGVVAIGAIGVLSSCEKVPAGYAGVVYSLNGGVKGEPIGQGMHLLSPIEKVALYPVSTETMYLSKDKTEGSKEDDSFNISSRDGKPVNVDIGLSYRYEFDRVVDAHTKWRGKSSKEIEQTYIRERLKAVTNEVASKYAVMDIYGEKRTELNSKVFEQLRDELAKEGIILETFNFTRIEPDTQTLQAIQAKVDAQQKLEQDKIEANRQAIQNQKEIDMEIAKQEKANIENTEKNKRIKENAVAEAEAIKVKAEAEAEANKKLSASLTDKIIAKEYIEAWKSGGAQVSKVQGVNNATPFINIGK